MRQQHSRPRKRKSSPALETSSDGESYHLIPPSLARSGNSDALRPAPLDGSEQYADHDAPSRTQKRPKIDLELEGKVSELKVEDGVEDTAMDDYAEFDLDMDMEVDFDIKPAITSGFSATAVPKKEAPSWLTLHSSLLAAPAQSEEALDTSSTSVSRNVDALETDGSLHMYWLDFAEVKGKLYLVGKVFDKTAKKYVSCCLGIDGLERNLFVVPRDRAFGTFHLRNAFRFLDSS